MKWTAEFTGRENGAIGRFSKFKIEVEGDTYKEAHLAIYDTHEHLRSVNLRPSDPWDDDPEYPVEDWKYEVQNGDTRRGYADWCAAKREADDT